MHDCSPSILPFDSSLASEPEAASAVLRHGNHPRRHAACQPECSWAVRSKTALLLALIFKRAGASLWQSAVPGMLQFGRQSPAHTRTVRVQAAARGLSMCRIQVCTCCLRCQPEPCQGDPVTLLHLCSINTLVPTKQTKRGHASNIPLIHPLSLPPPPPYLSPRPSSQKLPYRSAPSSSRWQRR